MVDIRIWKDELGELEMENESNGWIKWRKWIEKKKVKKKLSEEIIRKVGKDERIRKLREKWGEIMLKRIEGNDNENEGVMRRNLWKGLKKEIIKLYGGEIWEMREKWESEEEGEGEEIDKRLVEKIEWMNWDFRCKVEIEKKIMEERFFRNEIMKLDKIKKRGKVVDDNELRIEEF